MRCQSSPVLLGEYDRSVEISGFRLTETVRASAHTLPWHSHEHTNIAFVVSGCFIESIGNQPQECGPCGVIIRPAGEAHFNQYSVETKCLIIEVRRRRLEMFRQISDALNSAYYLRDEALSALALRMYKEFRLMDSASSLAIEALILEILAHLTRQNATTLPSTEPRWLPEARDLIHENFSEQISLSDIAEMVGVHPAHLARMFRKHYQCTVGDYVRQLRLDHAVEELSDPEKSLVEIALAAGFYDQSHFTHVFKLSLGITPAEFRAITKTRKPGTKKFRSSKTS